MERWLSWLEPAGFAVGLTGFLLAQVPICSALLAAVLLAAIIAAGRGLVPKDPVAGAIAAAVFGLALPLRFAPVASLVAACLAVAGLALGLRRRDRLGLVVAAICIAASAFVAWGAALALGATVPAAFDPRRALAISGGAIGVGAGLLGAGFGTLTGLPHARWLLAGCGLAVIGDPIAFLGVVAVGIVVIPSAIVRVVGSPNRIRVALAAGAPLLAAAIATAQ